MKETAPALLKRWDPDFAPPAGMADAYVVPPTGEPRAVHDELYQGCGVALVEGTRERDRLATRHRAQDLLLVDLIRSGVRGPVRVPVDPAECDRLRTKWEKHAAARGAAIADLIAERTSDEALRVRIRDRLGPLLAKG